jgi:hypothetical protein
MTKKGEILIQDIKSWAWQLPPVIRRLFIKTYCNQGFVYIEDTFVGERPTYCSDRVRWLDKLTIETHSSKRADKLSWKFLREKYPQYTNFIQLF